MDDSKITYATVFGSLGLSGMVFTMNALIPEPAIPYLIMIGTASICGILISVWCWFNRVPVADKNVTDALFDLALDADQLIKQPIKEVVDQVTYPMSAVAWNEKAESLIKANMNDEEFHMFATLSPRLDEEDPSICKAAIAVRADKSRRITGRFFRGENWR